MQQASVSISSSQAINNVQNVSAFLAPASQQAFTQAIISALSSSSASQLGTPVVTILNVTVQSSSQFNSQSVHSYGSSATKTLIVKYKITFMVANHNLITFYNSIVNALKESVSSQAFVQSYRSNCAARCSAQMQAVQVSSPPVVSPPVVVPLSSSGVPSGAPAVDSSSSSSSSQGSGSAEGFNSLYAIGIVFALVLLIVAAIIYYRSLPNESSKYRGNDQSVEDQMDMGKMYGSSNTMMLHGI